MLQPGALAFFVSGSVAATRWPRVVLLTLQILRNYIERDPESTGVLVGLQVAAHPVPRYPQGAIVFKELQIPVDSGLRDPGAASLFDLDVATDNRSGIDEDCLSPLGLDVAIDAHATGTQRRPSQDHYVAFGTRAIQRAGAPIWHNNIIERSRPYGPSAPGFFGEHHR